MPLMTGRDSTPCVQLHAQPTRQRILTGTREAAADRGDEPALQCQSDPGRMKGFPTVHTYLRPLRRSDGAFVCTRRRAFRSQRFLVRMPRCCSQPASVGGTPQVPRESGAYPWGGHGPQRC
ncbi:hypothethical protein [Ralstonia solanacearum Po82]|uniref:Hypothethical protein n=1 Tax=Ralstonia solanacearum (strain Po82) TaxID=1031711 RepID=F6G4Z5_RALS8|nr:hypothethical protein [Ralstonia solanacearum Po82]